VSATLGDLDDADDDRDGLVAEINVTPLVDVMLVLLIVFMVAAPLMVHGVPVELPKAGGTALGRPSRPLIVSLTRSGALYLRDEKIGDAEFADRLRALRASEGDTLAYVRADRGIPYGAVMDVIGRVGEGGFSRVSLLTQPPVRSGTP
jgi:biopolymer transport protein TolR